MALLNPAREDTAVNLLLMTFKSLDDKWSERFSRLEALLLNKSFAVPVRPVNPSAVVTREHPFFDPGASSSVMFTGLVTEGTGSSLVQTTGEAAQLTATQPLLGVPGTIAVQDVNKSATREYPPCSGSWYL